MNIDFHYYCVAVLARAAGFPPGDALTIAYASQYVDDATESDLISIGDTKFEPVRTAHAGLGYVSALRWAVQKRIYLPFHFLPPYPFTYKTHKIVTVPNSLFARRLLEWADSDPDPRRRLCAIGIALHTYADTWAHKGFSGGWNKDNDVESIYVCEGGMWKPLTIGNVIFDFQPPIGHVQAGSLPDIPYLVWKFTCGRTGEVCERNNPRDYLNAAQRIYQELAELLEDRADSAIHWKNLHGPIRRLFTLPQAGLEQRCAAWQQTFAYLFEGIPFAYDRLAWRTDALDPGNLREVAWDAGPRRRRKHLRFNMAKGFFESQWVQFHRAALRQRHFVLEHMY